VLVPIRGSGDDVLAAASEQLGAKVTNLYMSGECHRIPTFRDAADRARHRYVHEFSRDRFDIGYIEVAASDLGKIAQLAASQAISADRVKAMANLHGVKATRAALADAINKILA
jgi:hypothetical protein